VSEIVNYLLLIGRGHLLNPITGQSLV